VAVWPPLEVPHLLRKAIVWNASEQLKLGKQFDRVVEEVRGDLKVVECREAAGRVVLERSVQVVVRILIARHAVESMRIIR